MFENILVLRLKELLDDYFYWDDIVCVTYADVCKMIDSVAEIDEQYPDSPSNDKRVRGLYTMEWHVGRIKYFINHPGEINPIKLIVDEESPTAGAPFIQDGNHRFIAAVVSGLERLSAICYLPDNTRLYLNGEREAIENA